MQVLEGCPIAPTVIESCLVEEVSKVEWGRCRCTVIGIVVAERLHGRLTLERITKDRRNGADVQAPGFVNKGVIVVFDGLRNMALDGIFSRRSSIFDFCGKSRGFIFEALPPSFRLSIDFCVDIGS